ncbi:MAG: histidine kinase [Pseudomonadota bacterium]
MSGPAPSLANGGGQVPDFRNLGTILRAILLAEAVHFTHRFIAHEQPAAAVLAMAEGTPLFETGLLAALLLLFLAAPWLMRFGFWQGARIAIALAACATMLAHALLAISLPEAFDSGILHSGLLAALLATLIFFYFHWRQLTLSPALADARLMALQARIRPHFLFNSLNTVLGLIRSEPKRAEAVLENLADLFRALMAEPRVLVPLERELELARAYAEVESMRLGERLTVGWHCEGAPLRAEVPQLILQPLIENAVIHGIEPSTMGGEVNINIFAKGDRLVIVVRNPYLGAASTRTGNHIALANIRERLDLHFDAEARMTHFIAGGEFVVQIEMPLRDAQAPHGG